MVQPRSKSKKIHNVIHTAEEENRSEQEHMAEGVDVTRRAQHLACIGNKRTHHQDHKLPAPLLYILLNPHPLEADGLNCRVASIFKLDILVIS